MQICPPYTCIMYTVYTLYIYTDQARLVKAWKEIIKLHIAQVDVRCDIFVFICVQNKVSSANKKT